MGFWAKHKSAKERRRRRVRAKVRGTAERPRVSVFRSLRHIYAQIIDDTRGVTLAAASDLKLNQKDLSKTKIAYAVGLELAKRARKQGIKKVVFDRGPYKYHGRVKALAEGLREGGLEF